jgi:glycosyltransferase involved in cell wall biosynthesis
MTRLAVIVTTYNWPSALERVLLALIKQTHLPDEIWVADDGSSPETEALVKHIAEEHACVIHHVWHEDQGFRAAAIRNRALKHIQSEYVIFLDGDCVPFQDFIRQHLDLAEIGYSVVGNRVLLSQEATPRWLVPNAVWPIHFLGWFNAWRCGAINRWAPLCRFSTKGLWSYWRKWGKQGWEGAKTCNLAFWLKDLKEINGFDESYSGWGLEDSDLMIRALRYGVRRKSGRFATGVLHLWHPENDRSYLDQNGVRLHTLQKNQLISSLKGLSEIAKDSYRVKVFNKKKQ